MAFRGNVSQARLVRMQNAFEGALQADGVETSSGMRLAQYNPPFTPPPLRRNELLIDLR